MSGMQEHRFRQRLEREFLARREKNPRYSLRAFAAFLGTDHSTLSQVLKGSRRAPVKQLRAWCRKLAISPEEITVYLAAEHVPDAGRAQTAGEAHADRLGRGDHRSPAS